ncbi:MAG: hypothetical protein H7Z37_00540 [Pyrinomonadaceae bacterium]|nr:hypothetical protein [Pyrinomonadaceae bacterium]
MAREFKAGDVLIFQLESGYGLLKVLAVDETDDDVIWHLAAFEDLFLDGEMAEMALENQGNMRFVEKHLALTNRAFESTPTAKLVNIAPTNEELQFVESWRNDSKHKLNDLSVRLLLGLR